MSWLVLTLVITATAPVDGAQSPASPPPSGNLIVARDGDVIVVENDARVRIVRRRDAYVRAVFNATERWLLLLVDRETSAGAADGRVDWVYHYREIEGAWPFDAPWEGAATLEEYSMVAPVGPGGGLGIATPHGLMQVLGSRQDFRDPNAVAVLSSRASGNSVVNGLGVDDAERWYTAELRRNDGVMRSPSGTAVSASLSVGPVVGALGTGTGAVRVGANIRPPVKIVDVPAVLPEQAGRAGIRGVVIVEVTIDVDGTVKHARVLRSLPILDAAALEAVRQWRYEPTTIGGKPVPVIMTVSVAF